jgi:HEAT repeat protein
MIAKRLLFVTLLALSIAGCGAKEVFTSGGRTASYWADVLVKPDPDVKLRRKAVTKLGPLSLLAPEAIPGLLAALKDADPGVRMGAARALGIYSGPKAGEVVPALSEVQHHDPNKKVREAAARAVKRLAEEA